MSTKLSFLGGECWKNMGGERGSPVLSGCCLRSVFGSGDIQGCSAKPGAHMTRSLKPSEPWPGAHPRVALSTWTPRAPGLLLHQQPHILCISVLPATAVPPSMFQRAASCSPSNHRTDLTRQTGPFLCHPVYSSHASLSEFWTPGLGGTNSKFVLYSLIPRVPYRGILKKSDSHLSQFNNSLC